MKSAYVICALLGLTIGTLTLADNGMTRPMSENNVISLTPSNSTELPNNNTTTAIPSPGTSPNTATTLKNTTVSPIITTPSTTTPIPTTPNTSSTTSSTTPSTIPTSTTTKTTSHPSTTVTTSTSTTASKTTAVPPTVSPSSKDRQFDGLSFFGGIILTTCLMAIAAFSWRFYRQCKDGSYRTL